MKYPGVRVTNNGAVPAKDMTETTRALRLLSGWKACPRCDGTRIMPYVGETQIEKGRTYHLRKACFACVNTKEPGWFQPGVASIFPAFGYDLDEMQEWENLARAMQAYRRIGR